MSVRLAVFLVLVFSVVVITHHETKPWDVGSWVDTLASLPNVAYSWIDGLKSGPAAFWGSLLGVFGAVLAVLIGVWSNARLNRVAMARALNYEITHLVSRIQVVYFTLSGAIHIAQPRGRDSFCGDILSSISVT